MAKKISLAQIARETAANRPKTWLDALDAEQRSEVLEVCRQIVAGKITGSVTAIAAAWTKAGVRVSRSALRDLVCKVRDRDIE